MKDANMSELNEEKPIKNGITFLRAYPAFKRQAMSSASGVFGNIGAGMTAGFTGTLLPQITHLVQGKESLLVGVNVLSTPLGIFSSSLAMRKFGRKPSLMYSNVPWILGWLCLSRATDFYTLLFGALLVGFSNGFNCTAIVVHTTETMEPRLRGLVLTINNGIGFNTGILLSHLLGVCLPWRQALLFSAAVPLLALLCANFVLESPHWLLLSGRVEEARKHFFDLRGTTPDSKRELDILLSKRIVNASRLRQSVVEKIFCREFCVSFAIIIVVTTVMVGSGIDVIAYYAIDVLTKMSKQINAEASLLTIDSIRIVAGAVSCFLIKFMRRRILYFSSTAGALISLVATILILTYGLPPIALTAGLCSYIAAVNLGIVPVSWALIGEIFPQFLRDIGSGMALIYCFFTTCVILTASPTLMNDYGPAILFSIFSVIIFFGAILLNFILPETRECTLQEVEDSLEN